MSSFNSRAMNDYGRHHLILNQVVSRYQILINQYGPSIKKNNIIHLHTIKLFPILQIFVVCSFVVKIFFEPHAMYFLTSISGSVTLQNKIVSAVIHLYIHTTHVYNMIIHAMSVFLYVSLIQIWFTKMRMMEQSGQLCRRITVDKWSCERLYQTFNEIHVLHNHFNATYCNWIFGCQVILNLACTLNFFLSVAFLKVRSFLMALVVVVTILTLFKTAADFNDSNSKTISSWNVCTNESWFNKFRKSCKPLRIVVGRFYYADCGLILTMLYRITTTAAKLVLAYKKF
ncbi:unnamed protein product [Allacma fusca]|uniref:Uncharacterized protein n=1 Tax=Allacma fusca TaxID=39272 RepID=A0A8J2JW11_9HEXA|nr:unnamed protein product [Allacma fusca]